MGRKYIRDNRGRFASKGTGATARGGRLRTAAGNKRATQTMQSGAKPKGTISKPKGLQPGAIKPRPAAPTGKRVLVKANARPENLFSRATVKTPGYGTDAKANVATARSQVERSGAISALKSNKRSSSVASVNEGATNKVNINASHTAWRDPRKDMLASRRINEFSTAKAGHYIAHELGHVKTLNGKMLPSWDAQLRGKGQIYADADKVISARRLATRVSKYARTSPAEFAAETKAALSLGKKFDAKVMGLYRGVTSTKLPSVRSQQRQQGVTAGKFVSPRVKSRSAAARPRSSVQRAVANAAKKRRP